MWFDVFFFYGAKMKNLISSITKNTSDRIIYRIIINIYRGKYRSRILSLARGIFHAHEFGRTKQIRTDVARLPIFKAPRDKCPRALDRALVPSCD